MATEAKCIRETENWGKMYKEFKFDSDEFNPLEFATNIAAASPKLQKLLENIHKLDAEDMANHGRLFKHFIYSDIKSSYGAKLIASALSSAGYVHAYSLEKGTRGMSFKIKNTKKEDKSKVFATLTSVLFFDKPIGVNFRKDLLRKFNSRPDNIHGEEIRFVILDSGFREGIDLFDIKYVHIFEPIATPSDEKQAIGRATRFCGQKGLKFNSLKGWPIIVYKYSTTITPDVRRFLENKASVDDLPLSNSTTFFDLFLRFSNIDPRKLAFSNELERIVALGAVDRYLNRNIHNFAITESPDNYDINLLFEGGQSKKPLEGVPSRLCREKLPYYIRVQKKIRNKYLKYEWQKVKIENGCVTPPDVVMKADLNIATFTPSQDFIRHYFTSHSKEKGMLLKWSVGTGKCFSKDTPILMYDGSIKKVQDVEINDLLMGDDSKPRTVLSLGRGQDYMYEINQKYGDKYVVNSEHILCLKYIGNDKNVIDELDENRILEIEVIDYLNLDDSIKKKLVGYSVPIEFKEVQTQDDPYMVGLNVVDSIPKEYLINSTFVRRNLLAGIIDRCAIEFSFNYIIFPRINYFKDIIFLCRSLGLLVKETPNIIEVFGDISIIKPNDFDDSTIVFEPIYNSIHVKKLPYNNFYGFTLDANNRFLLGDFTVTHNTCLAIATASSTFEKDDYTILYVTRHTLKGDVWKNMFGQVCSLVMQEKIKSGMPIPEAQAMRKRLISDGWFDPLSYKQFSNMLKGKNELYKELIKRNGKEDPLRKTLVIIDEAHKLFAPDVTGTEKPDVDTIKKLIHASMKKSGKDSVKVMLMTATPYTDDPMDMMRLLNIIRPKDKQFPEDFEEFANKYLDENGKFSKKGEIKFLDDIAGTISYLNREKDMRSFSYPIFKNIDVPLSDYTYLEKLHKYMHEEGVYKSDSVLNKNRIRDLTDGVKVNIIKEIENAMNNSVMKTLKDDVDKCKESVAKEVAEKSNLAHQKLLLENKNCHDIAKKCKDEVKEKYKEMKQELKDEAKVATKNCGKDKECKAAVKERLKEELDKLKEDEKFDLSECKQDASELKDCLANAKNEYQGVMKALKDLEHTECDKYIELYQKKTNDIKEIITRNNELALESLLKPYREKEKELEEKGKLVKDLKEDLDENIKNDISQRTKLENCLKTQKIKPAYKRILAYDLPMIIEDEEVHENMESINEVVDSNKLFMICGHGNENVIDFSKRIKMPQGKVLVLFPVCGRVNYMDKACLTFDIFNNPANKKYLRDPIKYREALKALFKTDIHIFLPGELMPELSTDLFLKFNKSSETVLVKSGVFHSKVPLINNEKITSATFNLGSDLCKKYIGSIKNPLEYTSKTHHEIFKGNIFKPGSELTSFGQLQTRRFELIDIMNEVGDGIYYYIGCRAATNNVSDAAYERIFKQSVEQQNAEKRHEKIKEVLKNMNDNKEFSPLSPSSVSSKKSSVSEKHISPVKEPEKPKKVTMTKKDNEKFKKYMEQYEMYYENLLKDTEIREHLEQLKIHLGELPQSDKVVIIINKINILEAILDKPEKYSYKLVMNKKDKFIYLNKAREYKFKLDGKVSRFIVNDINLGCVPEKLRIKEIKCSTDNIISKVKKYYKNNKDFVLPMTPKEWNDKDLTMRICTEL